jgi:hypothetical protein
VSRWSTFTVSENSWSAYTLDRTQHPVMEHVENPSSVTTGHPLHSNPSLFRFRALSRRVRGSVATNVSKVRSPHTCTSPHRLHPAMSTSIISHEPRAVQSCPSRQNGNGNGPRASRHALARPVRLCAANPLIATPAALMFEVVFRLRDMFDFFSKGW